MNFCNMSIDLEICARTLAFIEKLLNLDVQKKYFIITCGEEIHFAYNRVGCVDCVLYIIHHHHYLTQVSWQLD